MLSLSLSGNIGIPSWLIRLQGKLLKNVLIYYASKIMRYTINQRYTSFVSLSFLLSPPRLRTLISKKAYWMEKVHCQGAEVSLSQCQTQLSNPRNNVPCSGGMNAVVRCVPGSQFTRNGRVPAPPAVPVSLEALQFYTIDMKYH